MFQPNPLHDSSQHDGQDDDYGTGPTDISALPDSLLADPGDALSQSSLLNEIRAASIRDTATLDAFNSLKPKPLYLDHLRHRYEDSDPNVVSYLSNRHFISIDNDLRVPVGSGQLHIATDVTMIDYHLTVAKNIGFASILPNSATNHRWQLELDLHKPNRPFKGKHALVGFDTKGRLLYVGSAINEDIFVAMAPNAFFRPNFSPDPPGHSSGPSQMTTRHYRQVVMMFAHFLTHIPERHFALWRSVYDQDLSSPHHNWGNITSTMYFSPCSSISAVTDLSIQVGEETQAQLRRR